MDSEKVFYSSSLFYPDLSGERSFVYFVVCNGSKLDIGNNPLVKPYTKKLGNYLWDTIVDGCLHPNLPANPNKDLSIPKRYDNALYSLILMLNRYCGNSIRIIYTEGKGYIYTNSERLFSRLIYAGNKIGFEKAAKPPSDEAIDWLLKYPMAEVYSKNHVLSVFQYRVAFRTDNPKQAISWIIGMGGSVYYMGVEKSYPQPIVIYVKNPSVLTAAMLMFGELNPTVTHVGCVDNLGEPVQTPWSGNPPSVWQPLV